MELQSINQLGILVREISNVNPNYWPNVAKVNWMVAEFFDYVPDHRIEPIGTYHEWYRRDENSYTLHIALDSEGREMESWSPNNVAGRIDDAMKLVMAELPDRYLDTRFHETCSASVYKPEDKNPLFQKADTMPLAILKAFFMEYYRKLCEEQYAPE